MHIGEKIKRLRTAKLMTQSELVGREITRNMLSRIENGAAQPSMSTIKYIAERLNVSPGFLLAEEEDELLYFKSAEISNLKKAYVDKNYELCRQICLNSEWRDDELVLVLAESTAQVGINEFFHGNLRRAAELFDEAIEYCAKTVYNTDSVLALARCYFEYMSFISPTLDSNLSDGSDEARLPILKDRFVVYAETFLQGEANGYSDLPFLDERLSAVGEESSFAMHIKAKLLIERGEYGESCVILKSLLFGDGYEMPEPMIYFILCDLEVCCKETEDFKGAYGFSKNKIELMQKLLS
jgi:transcriptional regulator with XRE-family HTH domain